MKSSTALRLARKEIEKYEWIGVCSALRNVGGSGTKAFKRIGSVVPGQFITAWLRHNCENFVRFDRKCRSIHKFNSAMQDYRLRWIDWLIPQYEAKGD